MITVTNRIKQSIEDFEKMSSNIFIFNGAIHKFLMQILEANIISEFVVTYGNSDVLVIWLRYLDGSELEETYTYDKELYNDGNSSSSNTNES